MNDTQLTAIIIGLTGILRTRFPKIEGVVVPGVAVGVGATLSALADPANWRQALFHGIGIALTAVGGMTAIGYAGTKLGEALGASPTTDSAPSVTANGTPAPATSVDTAASAKGG